MVVRARNLTLAHAGDDTAGDQNVLLQGDEGRGREPREEKGVLRGKVVVPSAYVMGGMHKERESGRGRGGSYFTSFAGLRTPETADKRRRFAEGAWGCAGCREDDACHE